MNILVTGIAGKSGRWFLQRILAEYLSISDWKIRAIIRKHSQKPDLDTSNIKLEYLVGDLFDKEFTDLSMKDIDIVLHLAGIGKSEIIVESALKNGVKWVILVHTTGVYSKYKVANAPYLAFEDRITNMLQNKNIAVTILRPTMIYGSLKDENIAVFIKMIDSLKFFPVVSHGKYPLQPVHEKDLGEAYYKILMNKSKTANKNYILSGKEPIYLIDIFKVIKKQLGTKNIFIYIPFPIAYMGAFFVYLFSFKKLDFRERVQRMVESRAFSHAEATNDFDYTPIGFEDGVKSEIEAYKRIKSNL